ncbi:hypothetical protein HMPREF9318_00264 [Streptococcus urinalis FB127-CNA-2]|uniref:Uncharacterized protein n=1 Tax=Streptococcus urinalis 2285-97 TaxID=764291 RepID=G5KFG5_9STRE|nr:hypothetical protein [Streptococcus urinalis]EHJ55697.1 hypothetical protein STRUR_1009 [Streptococcus urinalis 2285-97]EKS22066.1 hypothetical protein HMPREF9318_00264 [Streptococcus urinalis FB127-CNA-2]VEF31878.1 Uncharacterised protein [Streptococcus urinalis]
MLENYIEDKILNKITIFNLLFEFKKLSFDELNEIIILPEKVILQLLDE